MIELCRVLGCHRQRGHHEVTHKHMRWLVNDQRGAEYEPIYWSDPDDNEIVIVDRMDRR